MDQATNPIFNDDTSQRVDEGKNDEFLNMVFLTFKL